MADQAVRVHNGFFRLLEIGAADASLYPDAIEKVRRGELQGIMLHSVYTQDQLDVLLARLECHEPAFIKTWFPKAFKSWFYGQNLNLAAHDLTPYFEQADTFHRQLDELFPPGFGLRDYVAGLLSRLDGGRPYVAAPGPGEQQAYMFATLRGHSQGGYIPPHCENEYPKRRSYAHLRSIADAHIFSYVLALSLPDQGGALEIFDHQVESQPDQHVTGVRSDQVLDIGRLNSVQFRIPAGSLLLFDSGRYLHQLRPVISHQTRWTASSFMAKSLAEDKIFCWG